VGRNVAAGMTGGLAYMLDEDDTLMPKVCAQCEFRIYILFVKKTKLLNFEIVNYIPIKYKK
jgi:glutamate synthase domain-containing protein 3